VKGDVQSILDRIHSVPGRILGILPIWSSNLDREPLEREIEALGALEDATREGRSGLNVPLVWDALTTLAPRIAELRDDAEALAGLLDELDGLLGAVEKRTYLVMLLNNSELRGGGGALTGVGRISVDDGKLRLGKFQSIHDLRGPRLVRVPAPPIYERRYAGFLANTSVWLNAAYSPDIPDDSIVASRLYEATAGIKTQGVIVADPRGIAALLPEDAEIPVPGSGRKLSPEELPGFTYSGAYESFTSQDARRNALIGVGSAAFDIAVDEGLRGREVLEAAGRAVRAGHLRVVSFDEDEQAALVSVGAAGHLPDPTADGLLVLAQNRGDKRGHGSKIDYWIDREVGHQCEVTADEASCVTRTRLTNEIPKGLSAYAAGIPYGVMLTFLETYVPTEAEVTGFEIDNESEPYVDEPHAGWTSVGTDLQVEPGKSATVEVAYELPLENSYALTAAPQPLARDAAVEIVLRLPQDWVVRGPGRREDEIFHYEGLLDDALSITAEPDERTGLPALWQTLVEFWKEPLF
jgi:hypothetical protein